MGKNSKGQSGFERALSTVARRRTVECILARGAKRDKALQHSTPLAAGRTGGHNDNRVSPLVVEPPVAGAEVVIEAGGEAPVRFQVRA
jgi:hypothetical protein